MSFLGHIVSAEGIIVDPVKIEAIMNWNPPQKCNRGEKFLGLSRLLSEICTRILSYTILTYKIILEMSEVEWDDK